LGVFAYPREKGSIQDHAAKAVTVPIRISANSRTISSILRGREPMRVEGADRLCNACKTTEEKLVLWTLLDTGLRVSELRGLTP
jgi:integrase